MIAYNILRIIGTEAMKKRDIFVLVNLILCAQVYMNIRLRKANDFLGHIFILTGIMIGTEIHGNMSLNMD